MHFYTACTGINTFQWSLFPFPIIVSLVTVGKDFELVFFNELAWFGKTNSKDMILNLQTQLTTQLVQYVLLCATHNQFQTL